MDNRYIEIKSAKGIKKPIISDLNDFTEKVYWNIRFNIPLNADTVNEDNMDVTDVEGYILTSVIKYNAEKNAIIISPKEQYKPNSTYVLNVSNRVLSKGNNSLKEEVQIIFQLKGAEISSFKILKGDERLDIDIKPSKKAPTPAQLKRDRLPVVEQRYNFWPSIGALMLFAAAYMSNMFILIVISIAFLFVGIGFIIYQFTNSRTASQRAYNKGAALYNDREHDEAYACFMAALAKNPNNTFAARGVKRCEAIVKK